MVPKSDAVDKKLGVLAENLDKYSDDKYKYHVYQSDDESNFATEITGTKIIQNPTGRNTVSVSALPSRDVYLKVQQSTDGTTFTDVTGNITVNGNQIDIPSTGIIIVPSGKEVSITGLPKSTTGESPHNYTYKVLLSSDSNFATSSEQTSVQTDEEGGNTVKLTTTPTVSIYIKVKRSVGESVTQEDVTSGFTVSTGTIDNDGVIVTQAGTCVLIEELQEKPEYEYKVYNGGTELTSGVEIRKRTELDKVDVLTVLDNVSGDDNVTLTIKRRVKGKTEEPTAVTGYTAYRFFAADQTTGAVALPVDRTNGNNTTNNPNVVFENLPYGSIVDTTNNIWQPYYYTTVECDKDGYDADSNLTVSQTAQTVNAPTQVEYVDLEFKIDVRAYVGDSPTDSRKHINIMVVRDNNIVKTDVNGKPLKITVDGADFYASDKSNGTPAQGVIVIPVTPKLGQTYINCVIHDLPYAPHNYYNNEHKYNYQVKRCNAGGSESPKIFTIVNAPTHKENSTPSQTDVEYTKTWSKNAVDEGLKPDNLHLKLFRVYSGGTEEVVSEVDLSNVDVSTVTQIPETGEPVEYKFTGTIENLPAGVVVQDSVGDFGVWRKYTYFLKEYSDSTCANDKEKSSSNAYKPFEQTKGTDKPFTFTDNTNKKEATLAEGIQNTLTTTKHDVTKTWVDDNENHGSREDYYISLERRAGTNGQWEAVDLTKTTRKEVTGSGNNETTTDYNKHDPITYTPPTAPNSENIQILQVDKTYEENATEKKHIRFDGLPYCNKDGIPYQYRVKEVKVGKNHNVVDPKTYLFLVPGTSPTDIEYSYVRTIRRGTSNYYVNYNYDDSVTKYEDEDFNYNNFNTTEIKNEIIKDQVTFSNIEVTKKWDDENNLYGKRPQEIYYHLSRTVNGRPDDSFNSPDKKANEENNWTGKWDQLAAFAANGDRFEYFVTELPVANYNTSSIENTKKNDDGEVVKTVEFTNTYNPPKKTVTAQKQWDDYSNKYQLRPSSENVKFELYCKYDVVTSTDVVTNNEVTGRNYTNNKNDSYLGPVYDSTKTYAEQSEVFKEIVKQLNPSFTTEQLNNLTVSYYSRLFVKNFGSNLNGDTWSLTFGAYNNANILPAWINTTADGRFNGKAVEVTYYIVETFGDSDSVYKQIYSCEASNKTSKTDTANIAGTSKDSWVLEQGKLYSGTSYKPTESFVYTIDKSLAVNGTARVMIQNLPLSDSVGNMYSYTVTETASDGGTYSSGTSHNVTIEDRKFVGAETTGEVKSKIKQDKVDLIVKADNVITEDVYFKVTCNKTDVTQEFVTNFANCSLTAGNGADSTVTDNNGIIQYKASDSLTQDSTVTITISGLPKDDGYSHDYIYEAVEYDKLELDGETEYVALSLGNDKRISVDKTPDSVNNTVTLTITKHGVTQGENNTVGQDIYFKLRRKVSVSSDVTNTVLKDDNNNLIPAHPFFICSLDPDTQYVNDLTSANFDTDVYNYNILTENDIFCYTANNAGATAAESFTIKNLPKKDPYGFDYTYTIEKYLGYYPGAGVDTSETINTVNDASASVENGKINCVQTPDNDTYSLIIKKNYSANEKLYFKVKRTVDYSQTQNLGNVTVLKSEKDNTLSATIRNTLETRNITVALNWQDNGYLYNETISESGNPNHQGEYKVNTLHYNTEITLKCDSLHVNNTTYSEKKTIAVTDKNEVSGKRSYVTGYGVVFKDLPKYYLNGTQVKPYDYNIEQKIDNTDVGKTSPSNVSENVYKYQQINAYSDIETKSTGQNATAKVLDVSTRKLGENIAESETTLLQNSGTTNVNTINEQIFKFIVKMHK